MAHKHSKGINVSHIKPLKDKIQKLEEILQQYRVALKRHNGGWTNDLLFYIFGVSTAVAFWIWWMVCSLIF